MSRSSSELPTLNEKAEARRVKKKKKEVLIKIFGWTVLPIFVPMVKFYKRHRTWGFALLALMSTFVSLILAFVLAQTLLLSDINYTITNQDSSPRISFASNLINIDSTMRTFTIDWYPQPPDVINCGGDAFVANIFLDPNLLDSSSPGMSAGSDLPSTPDNPQASTSSPNSIMFQYDSQQACDSTEIFEDSKNTFRTVSKLADIPTSKKGRSTLQAYPIDKYIAQISMYALDNTTGDSIPMDISLTWGTVVNFKALLDRTPNTGSVSINDGIYLLFDVSRSGAVKLFVYCVIIANWIVTAAFLWLSIACLLWHNEKIIKEMFVIPVTALFAFTTVRANLPGAPAGFGAYVDFVGILPNLVLITFSSAALLLTVLARRVLKEIHDINEKENQEQNEEKEKENFKEDSYMISVLTKKFAKEFALKVAKKKSNKESESGSSDDEEQGLTEEYFVVRKKKKTEGSPEEGNINIKKKGSKKSRRPNYPRGFSESSTYKPPYED